MKIRREKLEKMVRDEVQKVLDEVNPGHDEKGRFAAKGKGKTYSLTKNAEDDVADDTELEVPARGSITSQGKIASKFGMNTGAPEKQCGRLSMDGKSKTKTRSCKDYPETYKEETEYMKKKKKETEKKNQMKNKKDSIPRSNDSPSVRREKIFPGTDSLWSLARGIAKEQAELEDMPRWSQDGKLITNEDFEAKERNVEVDDAYLKGLIKQAVLSGIQQARAEAAKQGQRYSWQQVMRLIQDLETAQKGAPKPK
jgi:hypothetical protein|tara:strand:- start:1815 stop:2576 length:762 start_codon:yes stop_codon:yes gene_type:complete